VAAFARHTEVSLELFAALIRRRMKSVAGETPGGIRCFFLQPQIAGDRVGRRILQHVEGIPVLIFPRPGEEFVAQDAGVGPGGVARMADHAGTGRGSHVLACDRLRRNLGLNRSRRQGNYGDCKKPPTANLQEGRSYDLF